MEKNNLSFSDYNNFTQITWKKERIFTEALFKLVLSYFSDGVSLRFTTKENIFFNTNLN